MANDDLVTVDPGFNAGFWQALDASKVASFTTGIWGYRGMKGNLERTSGAWRAMPVPQWEGVEPTNSLWGGSNWVVMEGSKNVAAALKFADWLAADPTAMNLQYENSGYYPASSGNADQVDFDSQPDEFFGGQKVAPVFAEAAELVSKDWQWGPSMTTVFTLFEDSIRDAIKAGDCTDMLNSVQEEVVGRLRNSGFERCERDERERSYETCPLDTLVRSGLGMDPYRALGGAIHNLLRCAHGSRHHRKFHGDHAERPRPRGRDSTIRWLRQTTSPHSLIKESETDLSECS